MPYDLTLCGRPLCTTPFLAFLSTKIAGIHQKTPDSTHTRLPPQRLLIRGSSIKNVHKKPPFPPSPPPVRRCPHLINPSPLCGRPHLSDSVIAGALKIRYSLVSSSGHLTPTPCGLICRSCN